MAIRHISKWFIFKPFHVGDGFHGGSMTKIRQYQALLPPQTRLHLLKELPKSLGERVLKPVGIVVIFCGFSPVQYTRKLEFIWFFIWFYREDSDDCSELLSVSFVDHFATSCTVIFHILKHVETSKPRILTSNTLDQIEWPWNHSHARLKRRTTFGDIPSAWVPNSLGNALGGSNTHLAGAARGANEVLIFSLPYSQGDGR